MTSPLPTSFISIEAESADVIHARMLDQAKQYDGDTDTQEGSPVWDATRPAAEELGDLQINIVNAVSAAIPSTSWGDFLDDHVKDVDLPRKPGEYASGTVRFLATVDVTIPAGTILATENDVRFILQEDAVVTPPAEQPDPDNPQPGEAVGNLVAESIGRSGNISAYTLTVLPREFQNLVTIRQDTAMTGGVDPETDAELKQRYFARIRNRSGAGNPEDYKGWALSVNGVQAAKVFRATPSPGSVTVAIASQYGVPETELVDEVQTLIDERANVLSNNVVVPAEALPVDMTGTLTLMPDVLIEDVQMAFETSVRTYFESLYYTDEPVRYSTLYSLLLDTDGVLDITDFLVNGAVANLTLGEREIPTLGVVTLT